MNPEFIPENDVNADTLAAIYKRAFFKCDKDSDGDLRVQTDGPKVVVAINENNKLIKFMAIYALKENESDDKKLRFLNRMNDTIVFARFSMPESRPDILMADYYLPYEDGVPAIQVVQAMRVFSKIVVGAIRACDEDDLVE
jgi:hypothetical protein